MQIIYIIGSYKSLTDKQLQCFAGRIIDTYSNIKVCESFQCIKTYSNFTNVVRIKNNRLTRSEEDFLDEYHGRKTLHLLTDPIMHDVSLMSYFDEVIVYEIVKGPEGLSSSTSIVPTVIKSKL
jgi:hypothetical protein